MSHKLTTARPMSELRRQQVHGPLLGMDKPDHEQFGLIRGAFCTASGLLGVLAGVLVARWIVGVIWS